MSHTTQQLSQRIDKLFTKMVQVAENRQEVLLGQCESGAGLTNTQEHILMLLLQDKLTNTKLADLLNLSPAAVTKALKKLQQLDLIRSERLASDERVVLWRLSETGIPFAEEHRHHHQRTLDVYADIIHEFSESEQQTILRFLDKLGMEF
jgi:DNA-binding MarR family transcriptional regulator